MKKLLSAKMKSELKKILKEDIGSGDLTSSIVFPKKCIAEIACNEDCVIAGLEEAKFLFNLNGVKANSGLKDGSFVKKGKIVLKIQGLNQNILSVERAALNVLGRMSAIATQCKMAQEIVGKKKPQIALTRKTMPGFNLFDKKAAEIAGAWPHRINLSDAVLVKENHLHFFSKPFNAVVCAKVENAGKKPKFIEIEVQNLNEAISAAKANPDIIMLDNFSPKNAKKAIDAVKKINSKIKIELSGGIDFSNLKNFAKLNADFISMGCLSKNAGMIDFSLNFK